MNIAVFFGGRSSEHNISVITAVEAMSNIGGLYTVVPIYIDRNGVFRSGKSLFDIRSYKNGKAAKEKPVTFMPASKTVFSVKGKKLVTIDAALNCCHGAGGEDGALQGYMRLCGIPLTGPSVLSAAVSIDKLTMKKLFTDAGLNILPYIGFSADEFKDNAGGILSKIEETLGYPVIVKPSSLGSSIGIGIAANAEELSALIDAALCWDSRIVVETALTDFSELNCAVLGTEADCVTSMIEKPLSAGSFLSYEDKYYKTDSEKRECPAAITKKLEKEVRAAAVSAFNAVGASGVARIDFLLKGKALYVNEINTVPGALSNYLFEKSYPELIARLIEIAKDEHNKRESLEFCYEPSFDITGLGAKGKK